MGPPPVMVYYNLKFFIEAYYNFHIFHTKFKTTNLTKDRYAHYTKKWQLITSSKGHTKRKQE